MFSAPLHDKTRIDVVAAAKPSPVSHQVVELPNFCPECGNQLISPNADICPGCGVRLKTNSGKRPGLAALCSFVFSGLRQVYNGNPGRGILLFLGTYLGLFVPIIPGLAVLI